MTAPDDIRPESPMPPPHIGGLSPSEARETILALRAASVRLYGREGHTPSDVQRMVGDVERLRAIVERAVAMIARGRALDAQAERLARKGGSGTPHLWAAEAYDELLADLDRDARAALEGKP